MVDSKRFLHLERDRPRREEPEGKTRTEVHERFRDAPRSETTPGEQPGSVTTGRFQADESSGLALDDSPHAVTFQRCIQCGADNSRFVEWCERCGGSLTTPEQRAPQVQLELEQSRARQEEDAGLAQLHATRAAEVQAQQEAVHSAALELGRALANRERDREEAVLGEDAYPRRRGPLAPRLLKQIPDPRVRMGVMVGGIGLLLVPWFLHGAAAFDLRFASLSLFVALFAPWRPRTRGFWRDF